MSHGTLTLRFTQQPTLYSPEVDIQTSVLLGTPGTEEFLRALVGFMVTLGFHPNTVNDMICQEASLIEDSEEPDPDERVMLTQKGEGFLHGDVPPEAPANPFDPEGPVLHCINLARDLTPEERAAMNPGS